MMQDRRKTLSACVVVESLVERDEDFDSSHRAEAVDRHERLP